jgi:hypothetical protein
MIWEIEKLPPSIDFRLQLGVLSPTLKEFVDFILLKLGFNSLIISNCQLMTKRKYQVESYNK